MQYAPLRLWIVLLLYHQVCPAQNSCDILIKNGKIIDGTGNNWYYGDIAIIKGEIHRVGKSLPYTASETIDVKGFNSCARFYEGTGCYR